MAKRIIACLDVRGGRVVKGVRFQSLRDVGDPVSYVRRYSEEGIDEIAVLDVSSALEDRLSFLEMIDVIARETDVPLMVGSGASAAPDAARLLDAGADKVLLRSAAIGDSSRLERLAARYGSQCIVLSMDVRKKSDQYVAATRNGTGWTERDALAWALEAQDLGVGEILLTSIERNGTRAGYDLDLISAFSRSLRVPLIASGGAGDVESFGDALIAGAEAAMGSSVFHDSSVSVADVKRRCIELGLEMRP